MRASVLTTLVLCNAALALAGAAALAQPARAAHPAEPAAAAAAAPAAGAPTDGDRGQRSPPAPGGARRAGPATARRTIGPNGKPEGDTTGLTQFETGIEYEPRSRELPRRRSRSRTPTSPELVRVIGAAHGQALHLRRQGPQHQGDRLLAAEGHRRRGVPGVPLDPRDERPHRRPARALPQDRRDAGDRDAGRRRSTAPARAAPGEDRYVTRIHRLAHVERRRGRQRPRQVQVEGRRHHRLRARATSSSSRTPARTSGA